MHNFKLGYSVIIVLLSLSLSACSTGTEEPKKVKEDSQETDDAAKHAKEWSYQGETGPEHWSHLDPANSKCLDGNEQSPINIEFSQVEKDKTDKLANFEINYAPVGFSIENNGHTIQANPTNHQNSMLVNGTKFNLNQFHFHTPSEHQFNGKHFDMELHLVHKAKDNQLAVLGIMIKEGKENPYLAELFGTLPAEKTKQDIQLNQAINIEKLLPKDKKTYYYNGSLTTPPCTEQVKWVILEQPIEMSKEQINQFRQIFPESNRPIQSVNDRKIITN